MIDPGAIPEVGGDLEAVAAAGGQLTAQGQAVSDTGSQVHATWQRLASVYVAAETGELLAATGPVRVQSASVGGRLICAGAALVTYADEVRPIQAQLVGLRSSAWQFVASVQDVQDWQSDGGKVAEHNGLLSGVSSAVAAWMEAQRRCANAIAALDGGVQYVPDNGDGTARPDEYGYSVDLLSAAARSEQGVPWGRPEEEDLPWYADAGHALVSFGKGIVVDGLWEGAKGLGTLVNPWSDGFGASWAGLGKLGLALNPQMLALNQSMSLPGLPQGELSRTLQATGKGLIAWDTWKTDPARALGATLTNIVTAVVGTKGAGAALTGGTAAKGAVAARLSAVTLPKLADIHAVVTAQLAKFPKVELPQPNPALAGGAGGSGRYHFDVETPASNSGRVNNEVPDAAVGAHRPSGAGVPEWSPNAHVNHGEVSSDGRRLKGYHWRPGGVDNARELFDPTTREEGPNGSYGGRWQMTDAAGNVIKKPNGNALSKYSSFWPENMTSSDIRAALMQAYQDAVKRGTVDDNGFTGLAHGFRVQAWFDSDGNILTAHPKFGETS